MLLGIPCAPLLAVMFIILAKMSIGATLTVCGVILFQIFIIGIILNKLIPGIRSPILLEIPSMRVPNPLQIVRRASIRTYHFMKEAVPIFILAASFIFVFERIGGLELLENALKPVIKGFMGLPEKSVQVFGDRLNQKITISEHRFFFQ